MLDENLQHPHEDVHLHELFHFRQWKIHVPDIDQMLLFFANLQQIQTLSAMALFKFSRRYYVPSAASQVLVDLEGRLQRLIRRYTRSLSLDLNASTRADLVSIRKVLFLLLFHVAGQITQLHILIL